MSPVFAFGQIKLHRYFGGGEIFARSLAEAASDLGHRTLLIVHPEAAHWDSFRLPGTEIVRARSLQEAVAALPSGIPLLTHAPLPLTMAAEVARQRPLAGFVHMPYGQYFADSGAGYLQYDRVIPVSNYVASTLREAGFRLYEEPFYGFADFDRLHQADAQDDVIVARSEFEWDQRKVRDRLLGLSEPVWSLLRPRRVFRKRPGLTLGIVSRIAPIKQFPLLFSLLAPHLARCQKVNLEIFGAGGYASIRDLRRALEPFGRHVRYWGHQPDVVRVYRGIDLLLAGLPEREALGLNVIEAQAAGVPVLAVHAPPFTETVLDGVTGYFYRDPRQDGGADFSQRLALLCKENSTGTLVDPKLATEHLQGFSREAFRERVARLISFLSSLARNG